jgi:hypothetical protein
MQTSNTDQDQKIYLSATVGKPETKSEDELWAELERETLSASEIDAIVVFMRETGQSSA